MDISFQIVACRKYLGVRCAINGAPCIDWENWSYIHMKVFYMHVYNIIQSHKLMLYRNKRTLWTGEYLSARYTHVNGTDLV